MYGWCGKWRGEEKRNSFRCADSEGDVKADSRGVKLHTYLSPVIRYDRDNKFFPAITKVLVRVESTC